MGSLGTSSSCNSMHAVLPNGVQGMSWTFCSEACTSPTPACSIQSLLTEVGVCVSHSLTHSINQSFHSFIGLGTDWGPTDKVCVASMPDCILWHNHMHRLLCATCICSIATLIKQLFSHSTFNLSGLLHWLRCNEQWAYSLAACTCCSHRRCCTYKQTSKAHKCSVLVLDTG